MNKKTLHIIALDIPYPPNRGSVVGIFNRIKAFHEAGVEIILHAFYKEFKAPEDLAVYCKTVYLYKRKPIWNLIHLKVPLYIQSRRSDQLVQMLLKDESPILFEGLHTLYHFNDPELSERRKYVRLHNEESVYYHHLSRLENNPLKKIYYQTEAGLSKFVETNYLPKAHGLFTISIPETESFSKLNTNTLHTPPFITPSFKIPEGTGGYALFHGDLTIRENELAVHFLIRDVFNELDIPLIIAGFNPSPKLKNMVYASRQATLMESPDTSTMEILIQQAQIILAPIKHTTGYKMKLVQSLFVGRHIITDEVARSYTELKELVHFAHNEHEWRKKIKQLINVPVSPLEIEARRSLFESTFDNRKNAEKMLGLIFE
ncbi:MAG: hypothetical protein ABI761_13145 [Saprospiraceae bacterium]